MSQANPIDVNDAQILLLASNMERHPESAKAVLNAKGEQKEEELWADLTLNLNAIGAEKTAEKWKQVWKNLVQATREKKITMTDLKIMKVIDENFPGWENSETPLRERPAENGNKAANNPGAEEEMYAEEDQMKVQNRLMTHVVGSMNANNRVMELGLKSLNENIKKVSKEMKKRRLS